MATHQIDFIVRDKYIITELMTRNNIKFMRAKHEMLDSALYISSEPSEGDQSIGGYRPTFVSKDYNQSDSSVQRAARHPSNYNSKQNNQTQQYKQQNGNPKYVSQIPPEPIDTEDPGYYAHSAIFASGRVLAGDMYDGKQNQTARYVIILHDPGLVFEAFQTPGLVDVVKLLCGRRYHQWSEINNHLRLKSSVLISIDLPVSFVGLTFSTLFKHFALMHGAVPIAIYRQKTLHSAPSAVPTSGAAEEQQQFVAASPFSFANVPLDRTATVMSVASMNSYAAQHMSSLETDRDRFRGEIDAAASQKYNSQKIAEQETIRSQTALDMSRLLEGSNRVDNELSFVVTNPLPDFVLDSMDMVFILCPE
jgi:hypothetical protein